MHIRYMHINYVINLMCNYGYIVGKSIENFQGCYSYMYKYFSSFQMKNINKDYFNDRSILFK